MKKKLKKYGIQYLLSDNDICYYQFQGYNKHDVIINFEKDTGVNANRIINMEML